MTVDSLIKSCFLFLFAYFVSGQVLSMPVPMKFNDVEYDITVKIDPVNRTIAGKSLITVHNPRELQLMLGAAYEVTQAEFNDGPLGIGREQTNQMHIWNIPVHFRNQIPVSYTHLD